MGETEEALEKRANEICATCNGKRSEHTAKTKHMFTEEPGVLMTQAQADKAKNSAGGAKPVVLSMGNPGVNMPGHPTLTDRLIKVLLEKDLINKDEALFILGVGPEKITPARTGFQDPAMPHQQTRISKFKRVGGEPEDGDDS